VANDKKGKKSLGRDVFGDAPQGKKSSAVRNILEKKPGREPKGAKEVEVTIKLTPSNMKHLDTLVAELERRGKGKFTRSELIRVAITLLSVGDF
jgi:hypothetical protein